MIHPVKVCAVLVLAAAALPAPVAPNASPPIPRQDALYQVPHNGRSTLTRIRYGSAGGRGFGWGWRSAWNHDYPNADWNMRFILERYTGVAPIFVHPVLYMSEPGYGRATEEGIANLRAYLLKGGFLIFDDFELGQLDNMAAEARPSPGTTGCRSTAPIRSSRTTTRRVE